MKNIKNHLTYICIFILVIYGAKTNANAQQMNNNASGDFWSNVRFGGGLGLSFGNGFFSGSIAPSAIYQFNRSTAFGVGLIGSYAEQKDFYKSTIVGASVIGLYNPIREVQLSAEFEELYISRNFDDRFVSNPDDDYWYPALYLGAGYSAGPVTVGIRYDVLYDGDKSIYANPWMPFFRVYF